MNETELVLAFYEPFRTGDYSTSTLETLRALVA